MFNSYNIPGNLDDIPKDPDDVDDIVCLIRRPNLKYDEEYMDMCLLYKCQTETKSVLFDSHV